MEKDLMQIFEELTFQDASINLNARFSGMPHLIRYNIMSSRQPIA